MYLFCRGGLSSKSTAWCFLILPLWWTSSLCAKPATRFASQTRLWRTASERACTCCEKSVRRFFLPCACAHHFLAGLFSCPPDICLAFAVCGSLEHPGRAAGTQAGATGSRWQDKPQPVNASKNMATSQEPRTSGSAVRSGHNHGQLQAPTNVHIIRHAHGSHS